MVLVLVLKISFDRIGIGIAFRSIGSIGIDFGPVRGIGIGICLAKLVLSVSDHKYSRGPSRMLPSKRT